MKTMKSQAVSIEFNGQDIEEFDATQRALLGLFLAFQYQLKFQGLTMPSF